MWLMKVCAGLIMLALYWSLSSVVGVKLHNPPDFVKQGLAPEEMFRTLLTNKKQGNLDYILVHARNNLQ
jgi:hypothetical protein